VHIVYTFSDYGNGAAPQSNLGSGTPSELGNVTAYVFAEVEPLSRRCHPRSWGWFPLVKIAQKSSPVFATTTGGGGGGIQILNLVNNTLNPPFGLTYLASEGMAFDPGRNLILSASYGTNLQGGVYDLLQVGSDASLTEYGNYIGGQPDSSAEDCSIGIALSSDEYTDSIYITDLSQAAFTPSATAGTAGTWTAPGQLIDLGDAGYGNLIGSGGAVGVYGAAGTAGIVAAPGTNHLAVLTGEFGGDAYSALLLPSTSGSGTPALADWAYVSNMPNTPDGNAFIAGWDRHTVSAYTSPNTEKSYAVFADCFLGGTGPNYLGVVDLACVLAQPRASGTHNVVGTASACTRYVAIPQPPASASQ
jgi:hypothetical protein